MYNLNFIDMPDEFTLLLKSDMSSTSKYHQGLQSYISKNPSLKGILGRLLNSGHNLDINSHIKTLGWHGVRDRILSFYLNFSLARKHVEFSNLDTCVEVLELERQLRFTTVSGYSRIVLYGFYLFLDSVEEGLDSIKDHPLYPNGDVIYFLKRSQERIINIDFLILLIHHLIEFFGKEKLSSYIDENFSYESLYLKLSDEQKRLLCENFLSYTGSINEKSIFSEKLV